MIGNFLSNAEKPLSYVKTAVLFIQLLETFHYNIWSHWMYAKELGCSKYCDIITVAREHSP